MLSAENLLIFILFSIIVRTIAYYSSIVIGEKVSYREVSY